jgi:hypothetical protein
MRMRWLLAVGVLISSGCLLRADVYQSRLAQLTGDDDTDGPDTAQVPPPDTGTPEPTPSDCTWYRDLDGDGFGDPADVLDDCIPPGDGWSDRAGDCNDLAPAVFEGAPELCDGADNDCDGTIDDDARCPCRVEHSQDGHSYLFCDQRMRQQQAANSCENQGYHLVFFETGAENDWVYQHLLQTEDGTHWIGLEGDGPLSWQWLDGSPVQVYNWAPQHPISTFDCAAIGGFFEERWVSTRCSDDKAFVCEAP